MHLLHDRRISIGLGNKHISFLCLLNMRIDRKFRRLCHELQFVDLAGQKFFVIAVHFFRAVFVLLKEGNRPGPW